MNLASLYFTEYCLRDSFNPRCSPGKIINVQHAVYGRMNVGKCVNENFFMGCTVNVQQILDRFCSGKGTCDIPVINTEIADAAHCLRKSLTAYLEAAYYCQAGMAYLNSKLLYNLLI